MMACWMHIAELKAAGWIGVNGETVRSLAVKPAEPLPNLPNPVSMMGTAVRQPVRLDPDEADQPHRNVDAADKLADLSRRLDSAWLVGFKPVVPELSGAKGLRKVEP